MIKKQEDFMGKCFELARKGGGFVSPNPLVGAVLVKDHKIIGEGFHKKYSGSHAEVNAIKSSLVDLNGSTLYCNLEPCCHTKKQTPPCVPLIIKSGLKKVVISNLDPNPEVCGKGIKQLLEAGIEVESGICESEGRELNKFYFKFIEKKIPFITLKIAQSLDGKISESKSKQTWLTGEESKKYVHHMRSVYDAVLVGADTINVDNPELNVRLTKGRNPKRIILDGNLHINLNAKILKADDKENTWIVTCTDSSKNKIIKLERMGIRLIKLKSNKKKQISLKHLLYELAKEKITSILVEGGSNVFSQFLNEELFDELDILIAPVILGKGLAGFIASQRLTIKNPEIEQLGNDIRLTFRK